MPCLYDAAVIWHGDKPLPAEAWSCAYGRDDIFIFVLWPLEDGTRVGLFPLGGSEDSLHTPLIGQWKQVDESLRSTGLFDPGQLSLLPPELDQTYFEDILRLAGKPVRPENLAVLAEQISQMFTLKAFEYISGVGRDEQRASQFVEDHRWNGDLALPQTVLQDLADWNYQVVPYIQDLPWRVRGILLEPGPDGSLQADIWTRM